MATSVEAVELASHGSKRAHAILIPFPVQGQVNPMMHLAKTLTNHDQNLHITLLNNYHHHTRLMAKAGDHHHRTPSSMGEVVAEELGRRGFSEETLVQPNIGLVCVDDGLPSDFDWVTAQDSEDTTNMVLESCYVMSKNIKLFIKHLEENETQCHTKVSFVVVGIFCGWAIDAMVDLGIPIVLFSTQAAVVLSIYFHIPLLISNGFFSQG